MESPSMVSFSLCRARLPERPPPRGGSGQGVGVRAKDSVVDDGTQVRYRCGRGMDGGMLASDEGECERLHVDDVPR